MTGVVLAGGKSSRMGRDKGFLPWKNKPIILHVINNITPLVGELIIISNNTRYEEFGYPVYPDLVPDFGPLGGLFTAFHYAGTNELLVCMVDAPLIRPDIFQKLVNRPIKDAVIPLAGIHAQPLIARFQSSCMTVLEEFISKKEHRVSEFINKLEVEWVRFPENDTSFLNINDNKDYQYLINNFK